MNTGSDHDPRPFTVEQLPEEPEIWWQEKEREYVTAERATNRRLILHVILPNALPPLIIAVTLRVGISVIYEAALSFLGLTDPDVSTC